MTRLITQINKDGTILIPEEIRKQLGLQANDSINVYLENINKGLDEELLKALIHEGVLLDF